MAPRTANRPPLAVDPLPRGAGMPGLGLLAVGAVAFVLITDGLQRLAAPLGDSADGAAGSTWVAVGRALGPGGIEGWSGPVVQATWIAAQHPPGAALVAAAVAVPGAGTWAVRLPALLAALVGIGLVHRALRQLGASQAGAAVGVCLAAGTPLFLHQATHLRPEVLSLPAIAVLMATWSPRRSVQTIPGWWSAVAATAAGTTSWAGLVIAVALSASVLLRRSARGRRDPESVGLLLGTATAAVLTGAWVWQPDGIGFAAITQAVHLPSTTTATTALAELPGLLTPWVVAVALPGILLALWRRATRTPAAVLLLAVGGLRLVLRDDATVTGGWTIALVPLIALSCAAAVDGLAARVRNRRAQRPLRVGVVVAGLLLLVAAAVLPSSLDVRYERGLAAAALTDGLVLPRAQRQAYAFPADVRPAWLWMAVGRPAHALSHAALTTLLDSPVDVEVVVARRDPVADDNRWRAVAYLARRMEGEYALVGARDLVGLLAPAEPAEPTGGAPAQPDTPVLRLDPPTRLPRGGWAITLRHTGLVPVRGDAVTVRVGEGPGGRTLPAPPGWVRAGGQYRWCLGPSGAGCDAALPDVAVDDRPPTARLVADG